MNKKNKNQTLNNLRVTGGLYLLSFIIPTLNWVFILSPLQTSNSILEHEKMFAFNIANQILGAVCTIWLGVILHIVLKQINSKVSTLALILKSSEATLFLLLTMLIVIAFSMLQTGTIEETLLKRFIENYVSYTALPGFIMGVSMLLFMVLFYLSNMIPKGLAVFGIIAYALVILYDGAVIVHFKPCLPSQIAGTAPVCVFQIYFGFYLIFRKRHK